MNSFVILIFDNVKKIEFESQTKMIRTILKSFFYEQNINVPSFFIYKIMNSNLKLLLVFTERQNENVNRNFQKKSPKVRNET